MTHIRPDLDAVEPAPGDGEPSTTARFPALNAVRAVGALMVVLTHAAFNTGRINDGWVGAALARFDFGVTLFFVLSGFLLSRPWFLAAAARTARTLDPALPVEARPADPPALLGRGGRRHAGRPAERRTPRGRTG